jgi:ribulose-phosphate 3-epimerase
MLINPGYAFSKGEKQVSYADRKILELRSIIDSRGLDTKIELDGRISRDNFLAYGKGQADIFVSGSTVLNREKLEETAMELVRFREELLKH